MNKVWLKDFELKGARAGFFSFDLLNRIENWRAPEGTLLRRRWEYAHFVRAGLALLALASPVTATGF